MRLLYAEYESERGRERERERGSSGERGRAGESSQVRKEAGRKRRVEVVCFLNREKG